MKNMGIDRPDLSSRPPFYLRDHVARGRSQMATFSALTACADFTEQNGSFVQVIGGKI